MDALLIRETLLLEWPDCVIEAVDQSAAFQAALHAGGHDLVISDFTLPDIDGWEALDLTRRLLPDMPFIFLSGTIGEDRAIAALQAGVQDCVPKDKLPRLILAIQRALAGRDERRRRKAAERKLREHAALLDKASDSIVVTDLNGIITYWNRSAERIYGWTAAEAVGQPSITLFKNAHTPEIMAARATAHRTGHWSGEITLHDRHGASRHVQLSMTLIRDDDGKPVSRMSITTDITQQMADEARIRELLGLLDQARDAIIVSSLDGRITFWNQGAVRISGWAPADAIGRQLEDLFGTEARERIVAARAALDAHDEWRSQFTLRTKEGSLRSIEISATLVRDANGRPRARLSIANDITEKKNLEEQYLRAQRLESLGMLAAGISHDLNNVLAPILLAAPLLRDHATEPGDLRLIEAVEKAAERGSGLVRQILGFAHGASSEHRLIQIKHLYRDIIHLIEETFPKNIRLEQDTPPDLWPVKANPTHIHQILLNLCVNARDAMPQGGTLRLLAENHILEETEAHEIPGGRVGPFVVIHVEDTGTGIPPELLARIWEPFFTTKGTGKGTGLGLPTVRGIVESHGGFLTLRTEPGRGTTFRVYLPADESDAAAQNPADAHPALPRSEGELILVVDDEPNIRALASAIFQRQGYRVLTAADGTAAVAIFAKRSDEIRLVLTDLNMPNLDGSALANVVRRINPQVKILAVSGMQSPGPGIGKPDTFADGFMLKPFRPLALLELAHKLLHPAA